MRLCNGKMRLCNGKMRLLVEKSGKWVEKKNVSLGKASPRASESAARSAARPRRPLRHAARSRLPGKVIAAGAFDARRLSVYPAAPPRECIRPAARPPKEGPGPTARTGSPDPPEPHRARFRRAQLRIIAACRWGERPPGFTDGRRAAHQKRAEPPADLRASVW